MVVPLVVAALAAGVLGAGAGAKGVSDQSDAKHIQKKAKKKFDEADEKLNDALDYLTKAGEHLSEQVKSSQRTVIDPMLEWLDTNGHLLKDVDRRYFDGLEAVNTQSKIKTPNSAPVFGGNVVGALGGVLAGAAAGPAAVGLAMTVGAASTGTSISALSGVAATNATLALLGGGALAAGGAGIAGGAMALNFLGPGVGLLVGGPVLMFAGDKAKTDARKYVAKVDKAVAEMHASKRLAYQINRRTKEFDGVLCELTNCAHTAVSALTDADFEPQRDGELFHRAWQTSKAVAEMLKTPLLNEYSEITTDAIRVTEKYRRGVA